MSGFGGDFAQAAQAAARNYALPDLKFIFRGGERYDTCNRNVAPQARRLVTCDPVVWTPPGGPPILVAIDACCPKCTYPFRIPHEAGVVGYDEEGLITVKRAMQCPGHWVGMNASGHSRGHHQRCGWVGVIREGSAHHPRCPLANFATPGGDNYHACTCGGIISPAEREAEQVVLTGR